MKVFEYNPETNRKGRFLYDSDIGNHLDMGLEYALKNNVIKNKTDFDGIKFEKCFSDQKWIVHVGAQTYDEKSLSTDKWICFCVGCWSGCWDWCVLPPKNLIEYIEEQGNENDEVYEEDNRTDLEQHFDEFESHYDKCEKDNSYI